MLSLDRRPRQRCTQHATASGVAAHPSEQTGRSPAQWSANTYFLRRSRACECSLRQSIVMRFQLSHWVQTPCGGEAKLRAAQCCGVAASGRHVGPSPSRLRTALHGQTHGATATRYYAEAGRFLGLGVAAALEELVRGGIPASLGLRRAVDCTPASLVPERPQIKIRSGKADPISQSEPM
eukprot:SAG11_NODE_671_length_7815_cov_3.408631_2_plen_180_part_00